MFPFVHFTQTSFNMLSWKKENEKGGTDLKIKRISTQKKNTERFNIYIEREGKEEYAFAVDVDILIKYNLQRDKELDDDFVKEVLTAEEQQKAYRLSLNHLSYRMRATSEVEAYLMEKETPEHAVKHAIKRLTDQKYLNDQQFALAYTATKKATTPQGPGKIRRDLEALKVPKSYIDEALAEFTEEEELEKVLKFLRQKQKELARRSVRELKQKLQQTLMQRGFSTEVTRQGLQLVFEEVEAETEESAALYQARKYYPKYRNLEPFARIQKTQQALVRKGFPYALVSEAIEQVKQEEEDGI